MVIYTHTRNGEPVSRLEIPGRETGDEFDRAARILFEIVNQKPKGGEHLEVRELPRATGTR